MSKLLIVDDEIRIRNVIKEYSLIKGYYIDEASNGSEALLLCENTNYDLIIIDLMMPGVDGFTVVEEIRKKQDVPIIMLSARTEESDKLLGFNLGIDDYITKPFSPKELMARVHAILQRRTKTHVFHSLIAHNESGREILLNGEPLDLSPKEYELLAYLIKHPNIALSREQIINDVWGYDYDYGDRTVDTHIKSIRNVLKEYRELISTVRGYGYKYEPKE
ncbi:MAG: response regulator transcription factor [Tissierellia bacterium]|nr:response regulator transcription factor [Tissierellia bacterium]